MTSVVPEEALDEKLIEEMQPPCEAVEFTGNVRVQCPSGAEWIVWMHCEICNKVRVGFHCCRHYDWFTCVDAARCRHCSTRRSVRLLWSEPLR